MNDKRKVLYEQLSKDYDLGDFDSFSAKLDDEDKRKALYDAVSEEYALGDYDSFVNKIAPAKTYQPTEKEVQQRILTNKPDMFKPKTVDMYGAHDKDKSAFDLMQEGRSYDMQEANQRYNQRPITEFGEAVEQGTDALYQGGKNLAGETANIITGSQRDYERAKRQLDELIQSGYDLSNLDVDKAVRDYKDRDFQRRMGEWQRNIEARKADREDMNIFEALLHKIQDPERPKSQYEQSGLLSGENMFADDLQLRRSYYAIQDALKKSNGNIEEAYKLLGQKASKETWGDKVTREAREELAKQRPTKGFAAWVGSMIPQMIGTGAGIAMSFTPWGKAAGILGLTNVAALTASTAGMSMAEARRYAEENGLPANEGDVWKSGAVDAAIEYVSEKIPFDRYFNGVKKQTNNFISKVVSEAVKTDKGAKKEFSDLLDKAAKEFKLNYFSKDNIETYLTDVVVEGLSEFSAEALQTLSPIIYQNPEDYPTLMKVLENGFEGAKAGLFMGAFLGAGSTFANTYRERKRREKQGGVTLANTSNNGVVELLGEDEKGIHAVTANGDGVVLSKDDILEERNYTLEEFDRAAKEKVVTDTEDSIEADNQFIDSVTDPSTGMYTEVDRLVVENGEMVRQHGYIVGWINDAPVFLAEGLENTQENRVVLKPSQWDKESMKELPNDRVKAINEEIIREKAEAQAELESKYAPEVLNAQMQQGVPFNTPTSQIIPISQMPEGNGWLVEEYVMDTDNKVAKKPDIREMSNDEFRDIIQAQYEAQQAAVEASSEVVGEQVNAEVNVPTEELQPVAEGVATGEEMSPVEETQQQAPVIPTKADGSVDYVTYGKEGTFKELGSQYGEKMPHKVEVTAKAYAEDLAKAQQALDKAQQAVDDAPIGREAKAIAALEKAQKNFDEVKREADFWNDMDADIKAAQAERDAMLNPQVSTDMSEEPMSADEFIAQQIANGNIKLTSDSYKKETGYGEAERKKFMQMFRKPENGGISVERAGELLMQMDRENGTNFFDQDDANAGRDALINFLSSVQTWGDVTGYIKNNRQAEAAKASEAVREEKEEDIQKNYHMTPEEYLTSKEVESVENPWEGVDLEGKDAIFALTIEEYLDYEARRNQANEQGAETPSIEGSNDVLSEERVDNTGGTEERQGERPDAGRGIVQPDDAAQEGTEEQPYQQLEGESTLEYAERVVKTERMKALCNRANEWAKALGVKVTFLESIEDVDSATRQEIEDVHRKGDSVPGWVNKKGEVFFFMPDLIDAKDVDDTYVHEVVAHIGLKKLLGEDRFAELCDKVWEMMPQSAKDYYISYPGVNGNTRAAADEYIARLAEKQNLTPEEKTLWDNIVALFRDMLDKVLNGMIGKAKITDKDISELIKMSYANLKSGVFESVSGEGTKFRAKWRKGQLDKASRTIRRWLENNTRGKSFEIELPKATLDKVRKAMGRDFESHNITSNGIVHALKNHGENGLKLTGISIPLSKEDVELIPYIMTSPDRVEKASTDASGRVSVRFYKDLSNGYVVVVEKEYKNSPDDMETITMWAELSSKATNAQQNAAPDTHVRNAILSIDITKIRKDAEDAIEEDENRKEKSSFRVVKDKNGNKSLVGLHNISEEKLRKAIKQGGLANPSMAVIDMGKQKHVDYGEITLIAPESLVDKNTGRNVGTYTADAYTPVYPTVTKQISNKGAKAFTKALESVDETFRNRIRLYFNNYLDSGTMYDALFYWYLSDTGKNPPILEAALPDGYTREEVKNVKAVNPDATIFAELSDEERRKVIDLYIEREGGKEKYEDDLANRVEGWKKSIEDGNALQMRKKFSQDKLNELEEYGYEYDRIANYYKYAIRLANASSKPSEIETFRNAYDEVVKNGLEEDFGNWLMAKEEELGVEEKLFAGYDNQGRAKYVPNTLLNASKLMKKEGRAGATGLGGFNYFVAILAPVAKNTKQIRAKKDNLSTQEEYDKFAKKWGGHYHKLALWLQPGADQWADYGYHRLHEIAPMANPKEFVKKEYGIELSDKFIKDLNDVKNAIKNDFPARYFETKFERPVYLNEFAAAVVPEGTSKDIVSALSEAGLPVEQYEKDNNEARMAAVDKVSSEIGGIRFRTANRNQEVFVSNAQKAVDEFTSKYNSKPVVVVSSEMTDEELEKAVPTLLPEDVRKKISKGSVGGYSPKANKIYIFADNVTEDTLEDTLFHENLHPMFKGNPMIEEFYNNFKAKYPEQVEMLSEGYKEAEIPEESFVTALATGMQKGNFKIVDAFLSDGAREELGKTLKSFGYDYEQERGRRHVERNNGESSEVARDKEMDKGIRGSSDESSQSEGVQGRRFAESGSPQGTERDDSRAKEQAERLGQLFQRVAEEGLRGVVGDAAYDLALIDVYHALPQGERTDVAMNAVRNLGGNVAAAVDEYLSEKGSPSLWEKVVAIFQDLLRKAGFDVALNENDVKYLIWRSKKPLNRYSILELAEDVDKKYRLKVGEYNYPTRFRVYGGNRGYVGYSMSKRAAEAREEGRYPKTDFKKEYGVTNQSLDVLVEAGIIDDSEWHHTSKFGNKTTFYSWEEPEYADYYTNHKAEIDKTARELAKMKPKMEDFELSQEGMDAFTEKNREYWEAMKSYANQLWDNFNDEGDNTPDGDNAGVSFRVVTDKALIDKLEKSEKKIGYRNVVLNEDGTFSSPMAYWLQHPTGGAKTRIVMDKFKLGEWEEAVEHPELVNEKGKITLVKPNKKLVEDVAYDPYIHNRLEPVNLQFKEAWKRNDLVYVETEVAEIDLNSGYHADKAKYPVGVQPWSNGDLMLSKYDKPKRILSWEEVADAWVDRLNGEGVEFDVVPPLLLNMLVERGIKILPPHKGMGKECNKAYQEFVNSTPDPDGGGTRFRTKKKEKIDLADNRDAIIKKYDEELKSHNFNFQEAFQDRMLSVKVLMDLIEQETGKKARNFEDAYKAENQLGSINKPAQEKWLETFYKPLLEEMNKLTEKYGRKEVENYIYCKSGLERNEVLRQRDADEAYEEEKEELDSKLAKKEIDQLQYNTLLQMAEDQRKKTLSEDVDYSGIRGLLMNTRAEELFEQYQKGIITETEYKQKIADLKKNEEQVIKDWKKFAENQVSYLENKASKNELNALWDKINAATNETLRIDFESGMIDRETYEAEKKMMKYYVPLRNWENTTAEEMYEYRHDMTPAVSSNQKRAKGRKTQADNPIATIALMAQNAIVRGNRNKMKINLYSFVVNRPTALASVRNVWYVKIANKKWEPQYADTSAASNQDEINQIMEQFESDMQQLAEQGKAFKGKIKQGMHFQASRKQKDEHVVTVMINGKEYGIYINGNPRAAQAMNGMTNAEGVDDAGKWIDALKRYYGAGLTSWNPDFIIPNMVRDTIHATTMTLLDKGVIESAKYAWNVPKMFTQITKEVTGISTGDPKLHKYFEEFVTNGGETGYTAIHTLEDYKKEYERLVNEVKGVKSSIAKGGKNLIKELSKILEAANRIVEDVNRFNAYVTSRESGENIKNSIDAAKNITVNFNRKGALSANNTVYGKVASLMSRWILFFNPSVQGIHQLVTKSKANPKRAMVMGATILSSGFLVPMINEILVAAFGGDDDNYWNQSDYKRRNNLMLFVFNGYVSIPLPPVLRELYGMGDIMYGVITGHIPAQRAIYDTLKQIQSAVGFVNLLPEVSQEPDMITYAKGFAPDLAAPLLDVISNTNFMGRPIAKWTDYNEYDPEYMRVYKGVSPQWIELSKLLNEVGGDETRRSDKLGNFINPAMMEHLFTSYTGGIGKTINNLAGMIVDAATGNTENMDIFRKTPIIPRFYTPNDEKTVQPAINRKYYEFEYQYNNATKSLKKAKEGVKSGEHPEWQKYIDEMEKNGEQEFIKYFKKEQKKLKKLQDKLKEESNNKEYEKKVYDKKAEISLESFKILSGQDK